MRTAGRTRCSRAKAPTPAGAAQRLMIDCSHANSRKDPMLQVEVAADVGRQLGAGNMVIFGLMVESHLKAGRQDLVPGHALVYGQSVTDGCIGWGGGVAALDQLAAAGGGRREKR